jgi:hypothetical protein
LSSTFWIEVEVDTKFKKRYVEAMKVSKKNENFVNSIDLCTHSCYVVVKLTRMNKMREIQSYTTLYFFQS